MAGWLDMTRYRVGGGWAPRGSHSTFLAPAAVADLFPDFMLSGYRMNRRCRTSSMAAHRPCHAQATLRLMDVSDIRSLRSVMRT